MGLELVDDGEESLLGAVLAHDVVEGGDVAEPSRSARWLEVQAQLLRRGTLAPTALESATSIRGLRWLHRIPSDDLSALLTEAVPSEPDATFAGWLRAGAGGVLVRVPKGAAALKDARVAARRLEAAFPTLLVSDMTDAWLDSEARRRLGEPIEGRVLDAGTRRATLRRLRGWARLARGNDGVDAPISARWSWPGEVVGVQRDLSPTKVLDALVEDADPVLCRILELTVAARLLGAQIAAVGPDCHDPTGRVVVVPARRGRGADVLSLRLALPGWTVGRHGVAAFAEPVDGGDLESARKRLQRLTNRLGLPRVSFLDLRYLGQSIAYAAACSRATIRGVASTRVPRIVTLVEREQASLARRWPTPSRIPAEPQPLTAHAPPRCPLDESELGWEGAEA